jgi:ClpP class serine protease
MNFALAKEIYGTAWHMDAMSIQRYSLLLSHIRSGFSLTSENKNNSCSFYSIKNKVELVEKEYKLENLSQNDDNIAIIKLDGAITKNGGESSYGTYELAQKMNKYSTKIIYLIKYNQ